MRKSYHIHLPMWPAFSWTAEEKAGLPVDFKDRLEKIDGDLPANRLGSWREFHEVVEDTRFADDEFIFRGQQRNDWDLIPSLARGSASGIFTPKQSKRCLEIFRRASRGRKDPDLTLEEDLECGPWVSITV